MPNRTLIVGAGGQVGAALHDYLLQSSGAESVLPSARAPREGWQQLDLALLQSCLDAESLLEHQRIGAILCVAGYTYVDGCESEPERAFQVNAYGPSALAGYAHRRDIPFVYYSTDYLFDGSDERPGPYREDDEPHPLNVYGESKLAGEQAVLEQHPEALILRTAGVYGPDAQGKNYLYTVLRSLAKGETLRVPQDQISTPTYNADLAAATFDLLAQGATGVFHVCGPQQMSRLDLAKGIAAVFGLDPSPLEGVLTSSLSQRAARPLRAGLHIGKLQQHLRSTHMQTLGEALAACRPQMGQQIKLWRTS